MSERSHEDRQDTALSRLREDFDELDYDTPYEEMADAIRTYLDRDVDEDTYLFQNAFVLDGVIPSQELYDRSPREALEVLQLLPIIAMSDRKKLILPLGPYEEWFAGAMDIGLNIEPAYHPQDRCLQDRVADQIGCESSERCPVRAIRMKVLDDVYEMADPSSPMTTESFGPYVKAELGLAFMHRLLSPVDIQSLVNKVNSQ